MRRDVLRRELVEGAQMRKAKEQLEEHQRMAATRKRLEVEVSLLTGQTSWDLYLERVADLSAPDLAELAAIEEQDRSSEYSTPEEGARRRHQAAVLRARIEARSECARIPKTLVGTNADL